MLRRATNMLAGGTVVFAIFAIKVGAEDCNHTTPMKAPCPVPAVYEKCQDFSEGTCVARSEPVKETNFFSWNYTPYSFTEARAEAQDAVCYRNYACQLTMIGGFCYRSTTVVVNTFYRETFYTYYCVE